LLGPEKRQRRSYWSDFQLPHQTPQNWDSQGSKFGILEPASGGAAIGMQAK